MDGVAVGIFIERLLATVALYAIILTALWAIVYVAYRLWKSISEDPF